MSSSALQRVVADTPVDWWTRRRLEALIRRAWAKERQYTFEGLLAKAAPIRPEVLSWFLAQLVDQGLAKRVIRVQSPATYGGLGDFDSLEEIPLKILDDTDQPEREVPVTPRNVRVIYKFPGRDSDD